jgi:hypothetical protein
MHLHLLGTLKNNEELEMAVHEWSQKQETICTKMEFSNLCQDSNKNIKVLMDCVLK